MAGVRVIRSAGFTAAAAAGVLVLPLLAAGAAAGVPSGKVADTEAGASRAAAAGVHPRFATPISGGYWLVGSDGGVFSFGAPFEGAASSAGPSASPVVGMAYDPYTGGYWEPAANGDVLSFGGAPTESTGPI